MTRVIVVLIGVVMLCGFCTVYASPCEDQCFDVYEECTYNAYQICMNYTCDSAFFACMSSASYLFDNCVQQCIFFQGTWVGCDLQCGYLLYPCYDLLYQCENECVSTVNEFCGEQLEACYTTCYQ